MLNQPIILLLLMPDCLTLAKAIQFQGCKQEFRRAGDGGKYQDTIWSIFIISSGIRKFKTDHPALGFYRQLDGYAVGHAV